MSTAEQPDPVIPEWTFGDRLRKARELAGLRQDAMAALLHVSAATISNWEIGASHPRGDVFEVAHRWASITRCDLAWLLGARAGAHNPGYVGHIPHMELVPPITGQMELSDVMAQLKTVTDQLPETVKLDR